MIVLWVNANLPIDNANQTCYTNNAKLVSQ